MTEAEPETTGAEPETHVVFGSGQVGPHLATHLAGQGKRVVVVKRSAGGVPDGVRLERGDATDATFCTAVCQGADVVYHCMNPGYDAREWGDLLPRFMDNLVRAAGRAGARLVVLDNLYMLGKPNGRPLDEDTPMNPCSRKGEVRARVARQLADAQQRGDVVAVTGRASDYHGPGGRLTHVGDEFWPAVLKGKPGRVVVDPDATHTYHYIPDVAAGLATLGAAENDACGRVWMLPCQPAGSLRDLVQGYGRALGRDIAINRTPAWLLRGLGLFMGIVRELNEMAYQWDEPFVVRDERFRERFAVQPTAREDAYEQTVTWAQKHYGGRAA
jgi:nucleoside-diphosphate-sugar epimerase